MSEAKKNKDCMYLYGSLLKSDELWDVSRKCTGALHDANLDSSA